MHGYESEKNIMILPLTIRLELLLHELLNYIAILGFHKIYFMQIDSTTIPYQKRLKQQAKNKFDNISLMYFQIL